jgi:hypothetical protein
VVAHLNGRVIFKKWPSFGFLRPLVIKCWNFPCRCTAIAFRVTKFVPADVESVHMKQYTLISAHEAVHMNQYT